MSSVDSKEPALSKWSAAVVPLKLPPFAEPLRPFDGGASLSVRLAASTDEAFETSAQSDVACTHTWALLPGGLLLSAGAFTLVAWVKGALFVFRERSRVWQR